MAGGRLPSGIRPLPPAARDRRVACPHPRSRPASVDPTRARLPLAGHTGGTFRRSGVDLRFRGVQMSISEASCRDHPREEACQGASGSTRRASHDAAPGRCSQGLAGESSRRPVVAVPIRRSGEEQEAEPDDGPPERQGSRDDDEGATGDGEEAGGIARTQATDGRRMPRSFQEDVGRFEVGSREEACTRSVIAWPPCLAAAGVDQRIIDDMLGHVSPEMQRRYRHLTPELKSKAVAKVFGWDGVKAASPCLRHPPDRQQPMLPIPEQLGV